MLPHPHKPGQAVYASIGTRRCGIHKRLVLVLCVLVLAAAGCRTTFVRRGTIPEPTPTHPPVSVGSDVAERLEPEPTRDPQEEAAGADADAPDGFLFTLVDQNGLHPAGIPVEVTGPVEERFTSDASGRVRVTGPPGRYQVRVATGCTEAVQVLQGAAGQFGIAAGSTGRAELAVTWRHRYSPAPPAVYSKGPYWPPGEEIRVRYEVVDRCRDGVRAPGRVLSTFRVAAGDPLEILEGAEPFSDGEGFARVTVRCREAGEPTLVVADTENPTDELDLLEDRLSYDQGYATAEPPSCGDPYADDGV